jgi:tetratricopeptide (TPR) repeat protein
VSLDVIATSREALRVPPESVFELPPMTEDDGVALFCDRARVEPSDDARDLCVQLEGLPLAIELAAARLTLLTPEQLLERLGSRLELLRSQDETDPRHRTLQATIQWSYDLLAIGEQRLLARLSVFAGGCTAEAAHEVTGATPSMLSSLVDKSLLRRTGERYRMLETIREFASERLRDSADRQDIDDSHGTWFLGLAQASIEGLKGSEQARWLERLEDDHDNLRVALRHYRSTGEIDHELELIWALRRFWWAHGYALEAQEYASDALARSDGASGELRASGLLALADFSRRVGDMDTALHAVEECLELRRREEPSVGLAHTLVSLSSTRAELGDFRGARDAADEARALFAGWGDAFNEANASLNGGSYARMSGDTERAEALLSRAGEIYGELGDTHGVALVRYNLGLLELAGGNPSSARLRLGETLRLAADLGYVQILGGALSAVGVLDARERHDERGACLLGAAEGCLEIGAARLNRVEQEFHDQAVAAIRGRLGPERLASLFEEGRNLSLDEAAALALGGAAS